jgi:ferritin
MYSKRVMELMNEQIKHELYSAYLYLSMSAYFEGESLPGFAHWMRVQAAEEQEHAMKFYDFIYERGGRVLLQAIDQPPAEFESLREVFKQTLEHEKKVTGLIEAIYAAAVEDKDYASQTFLNWFIDEQVEEEKNATDLLETLRMVGDKGSALIMFDRELGRRAGE